MADGGLRTLVLSLGAWAAGCAQIIGAGDYGVSDGHKPDAARAIVDDPPILPAIPDSTRTDCEQCALDHCRKPRDLCVGADAGNPSCEQMLRCKGKCDDPDCLLACDDEYPESRDFDDYWDCVYGTGPGHECVDACGTGRNFECAGNYDWRGGDTNEITLDLTIRRGLNFSHLAGNDRLSGAEVRLCTNLLCDGASARGEKGTTDSGGHVAFTIQQPIATVFAEISEAGGGDQVLYYDAPALRDARREASFYGRQWYQLLQKDIPDIDDRPAVWVQVRDCLMVPAPGMDVALRGADSHRAIMGGAVGTAPDFESALTAGVGRATFFDVTVPAGNKVTVVTFATLDDRLAVAQREVLVQDGWWTAVKLYPRREGNGQASR